VFGIHSYGLFVTAGVLLNLTPGQDTMFILGRSLTGGLRAGLAAVFGIAIGTMGHTLAAALGLSAILATSALAFSIVKWVGAAYLIYLGARLLLAKAAAAALDGGTRSSADDPAPTLSCSRSTFIGHRIGRQISKPTGSQPVP